MIAWASMHRFIAGNTDDYAILIRPQWSIQDLMDDETPNPIAVL
jgi:N6-L-threonylcarbamoyladenine synthase